MTPLLILGILLGVLLRTAVAAPAGLVPVTQDVKRENRVGIHFVNMRAHEQHISIDWAAKDLIQHPDLPQIYEILKPGASIFLAAHPNTSPKYFISSTCNDKNPVVGDKRDHDTAIEVTFAAFDGFTYFDVDVERGFSEPVWCHAIAEDHEKGSGCLADMLNKCPEELKHHSDLTGRLDQCRGEDTKANVAFRRAMCPKAYVRPDDERTKTTRKVLKCTISDPKV